MELKAGQKYTVDLAHVAADTCDQLDALMNDVVAQGGGAVNQPAVSQMQQAGHWYQQNGPAEQPPINSNAVMFAQVQGPTFPLAHPVPPPQVPGQTMPPGQAMMLPPPQVSMNASEGRGGGSARSFTRGDSADSDSVDRALLTFAEDWAGSNRSMSSTEADGDECR